MLNSLKKYCVILIVFIGCAIAMSPVKHAIKNASSLQVSSIRASLGSGSLFAVLGGYRSLVADMVWIRSYVSWENKDISKCVSSMELACAIDPEMTTFWTQAASIIAFDIPHWLLKRLPLKSQNDEKLDFYKKHQARQAMMFLDKGLKMFPNNYKLLIQQGQIAISAKRFDLAEDYFRRATKVDDSFYSRRILAALLIINGKISEAKKILKSVYNEAEVDNPVREIIKKQLNSLP